MTDNQRSDDEESHRGQRGRWAELRRQLLHHFVDDAAEHPEIDGGPSTISISKVCSARMADSTSTISRAGSASGTTTKRQRLPAARAGDTRHFLERRIEIAQHRRQQDDLDRDRTGRQVRPDDAPERIDVERRGIDEQQRLRQLIQQSALRSRAERSSPSSPTSDGRKSRPRT